MRAPGPQARACAQPPPASRPRSAPSSPRSSGRGRATAAPRFDLAHDPALLPLLLDAPRRPHRRAAPAGISTAPSSSTTTTSFGNTATPPQPIGSCQPTNVRPVTDAGAAVPWHQTGRPVPSTPATSRTTPSLTSAGDAALAPCARRGCRRRCRHRSRPSHRRPRSRRPASPRSRRGSRSASPTTPASPGPRAPARSAA